MAAKATGRRRPALWAALGFAGGIAGGYSSDVPLAVLFVLAVVAFAVSLLGLWKGRGWPRLTDMALLAMVGLLGALRYQMDTGLLPVYHVLRAGVLGQQGVVRGRIAEEPESGADRTRFALELEEVVTDSARYRLRGRALVTAQRVELTADYGDQIALRGRLRPPPPARNPGAFDYRQYLALQDLHATLWVGRQEQVEAVEALEGHWLYEGLVLPLRRSVRQTVERNLTGAPAGLLLGMLLGEKRRIPEEVRQSFRATGLAHALVISGLHVGLVAVFFFTGFRLCRLPDRGACAATMGVLALYALLTELQPPVVRASLMAGVVLGGRLLGRTGEVYNSLGLAALLILAIWPTTLLSLSFQLSFGATLAIVVLHGPLARLFPEKWRDEDGWRGKWVVSPLCVSLAAQLGTGPLIAYHFQQCPLISLVANLAVVPLLGVVVGLGILSALSGWAWPLMATAFNAANYATMKALLGLVEAFAAVPYASVETPRPGVLFLGGAAILCLLMARMPHSMRARKAGLFLVLIGLNGAAWSQALRSRELEVVFLDVGQGDAAFVRFPDGKTMVVDGGQRSAEFDNGERVLLPFLRYQGVKRLDVVVASHPHNDHIGGLIALLEEVEVRHYVDSGQAYDSWTARRLRELIGQKGIAYHRVAAGDSLAGLGGVSGLVLHPQEEFVTAKGESPYDLNNGSVVFRLSYGEIDLLFTGDIEQEADRVVLAWGERLRAELLKVAHHGSNTSSPPAFVEAVDPRIAVVSVGEFNKFRHPAPEVMAHYRERGTQVLRTDERGAVLVRTNGRELRVETMVAE